MENSDKETNPYEAPKSITTFSADGLTEPAYADGMDLVFCSDFKSPRFCLITGRYVAKHVEPVKFSVFRFYIKNYPGVKVLYISVLVWVVVSSFYGSSNQMLSSIPGYLLFGVHFFLSFQKRKTHFDFYYVEFLKVRETKRSWKLMLILIPSLGLFVYGLSSNSFIFTALGLLMILNYILILMIGSVLKYKKGDKHYYRLGDIHPAYLARFPNLHDYKSGLAEADN